MRYEKSLDPEMTVPQLQDLLSFFLMQTVMLRLFPLSTDEYAYRYDIIKLDFDKNFVNRYTGIEISNDTIVNTLTALGFKVQLSGNDFSVEVPSWRATKDISPKADIIEEITRIYGYDNFEGKHSCCSPLYPVRADVEKTLRIKSRIFLLKDFLFMRVHSYVWAYYDEMKELGIEIEKNIKLINANKPKH